MSVHRSNTFNNPTGNLCLAEIHNKWMQSRSVLLFYIFSEDLCIGIIHTFVKLAIFSLKIWRFTFSCFWGLKKSL